jgi:hypothetical protein
LGFGLDLAFGLWHLALSCGMACALYMMPRHIRYIDKSKLVAIIDPSYFDSQAHLPIDKIDIIVLKY